MENRWGFSLLDEIEVYESTLTHVPEPENAEDEGEINPYILESLQYEYLMEEMFDIINRGNEKQTVVETNISNTDEYFHMSRDYERWQ